MINDQYFIYGILVSYKWHENWKAYHPDEDFDTVFAKYLNVDSLSSLSCIQYNTNANFFIIGRVLDVINSSNPIIVPEIDSIDKIEIESQVADIFDIKGDFHYYYVKIILNY